MGKRINMFLLSIIMGISCMISGVMLCGSLVTYAIESNIPVMTVNLAEEEDLVEVDEEIHVLVRERVKAIPKFNVVDGDQVWVENNEINIFKVEYDNDLGEVTVFGNGNKVIAPGTQNSYYFELQNNGNVGVDYQMTMNAYISDNVTTIPVNAKLSDYTGKYIIGSETSWEHVLAVNPERVNASGELSVGNKMRYIFSWEWPFESGDDAFDTMLGNLAVDDDITLTIEINTVAMADEYADGGFATGDDANIGIYLGAGGVAVSVIIFLIVKRRKEEDNDD